LYLKLCGVKHSRVKNIGRVGLISRFSRDEALWQAVTWEDGRVKDIARIDFKSAIASQDFHKLLMTLDGLTDETPS